MENLFIQMMYKSQFKKNDPYDWFFGPGSHTHTHTHTHLINKIITQNGKQHIKLNVKFKILK